MLNLQPRGPGDIFFTPGTEYPLSRNLRHVWATVGLFLLFVKYIVVSCVFLYIEPLHINDHLSMSICPITL